jgi:hypothetical protein
VPVDSEPVGAVSAYGPDRAFVRLSLAGSAGGSLDTLSDELEAAGHPVIRIEIADPIDIGAEFVRWEVAIAIAGAVLGIDPFDQPNVEEAKERTRGILDSGHVPDLAADDGVDRLLAGVQAGDYVAIQAFIDPERERELQPLADRARATGCVVTVGLGPRYLHSTGQLHKGGPPTGHFIQVVDDTGKDVSIPKRKFGFRRLIEAQAAGDYESLKARGRPVARVRLEDIS